MEVAEEVGAIYKENIFARHWVKCPDLHRKLMFNNLHPIGKGWRQFTKFLVFDIALFCELAPKPPTFVQTWGICNHEFLVALYISCNIHKKMYFMMWSNALPNIKFQWNCRHFVQFPAKNIVSELGSSPLWRWEIRKHDFCVILDILSHFHHESFSWIYTSTPPLAPWEWCCQTMCAVCNSGHFMQFLGKTFFCKLTTIPNQ